MEKTAAPGKITRVFCDFDPTGGLGKTKTGQRLLEK